MGPINVVVTDENNIILEVTPTPTQTVVIDRGVAGNGIESIVPVTISTLQYLRITYTDGTVQDVGPLTSTAYFGQSPIDITGNTISLTTVPIQLGGTGQTTANDAFNALAPSQTGNNGKYLTTDGTNTSWASNPLGTVTSVDASGGTTGLSFSGGPITTSGTLTMAGTLAVANGGTGSTTANGALTNLGGIGTITSTDGSITVTPAGTTVNLAVSEASPASTLLTPVRNTTGATLTKGTVVYISGATGQIATVSKALATSDATSAQTLGMITSDLANNTNGYVTVFGLLLDIDTSAFTDGAQLYLSPTTAGAVTATKPSAPNHLVYVGVVEYANPVHGKILVKVQNGYELDELHDVAISSPVTGQTITYNSSTSLWSNSTVSLTAGVNGTLPIANGGTGQTTANAAFNALAPSQTGNSGKYLTTDGTNTSWATNPLGTVTSVDVSGGTTGLTATGGPITTSGTITLGGTLAVANGGTGVTTSTGTGSVVLSTSPTLVTPALGTPTSGNFSTGTFTWPTFNQNTTGNADTATTATNVSGGTASVTTLTTSSTVTLNGGTANGVAYLNGSKVLTTGSALTFDGTNFAVGGSASSFAGYGTVSVNGTTGGIFDAKVNGVRVGSFFAEAGSATIATATNVPLVFNIFNSEQMRLTSTGLGIGTSSPAKKLQVTGNDQSNVRIRLENTGAGGRTYDIVGGSDGSNNNSFSIYDVTAAAERLNLNSSGNLGLGVTPSAWGTYRAIQLGNTGSLAAANGFNILSNNWYYDGATDRYIISGAAVSQYYQNAGQHIWRTAPSGTAGAAISFTQAMTLDASGNLGIGITSPVSLGSAIATVDIGNTNGGGIRFRTSGAGNSAYLLANTSGVDLFTGDNLYMRFGTNGTERMRIDSSGRVGVGTSTIGAPMAVQAGSTGLTFDIRGRSSDDLSVFRFVNYAYSAELARIQADSGNALIFTTGGSAIERARIDSIGNLLVGTTNTDPTLNRVNGVVVRPGGGLLIRGASQWTDWGLNATSGTHIIWYTDNGSSRVSAGSISSNGNTTSYNTSSDYRLKNITGPVTNSGAYIDSLNPVEGTWKADGSTFVGLIAHEVQEASRTQVATGEKDGEQMQGMDYSSAEIIANMIAELKSLRKRLADAGIA